MGTIRTSEQKEAKARGGGVKGAQRRARAEADVRESLELLEEAEALAGLGAFVWDPGDDSLRWSRNMHALAGMDPREFGGTLAQALEDSVHPDDRPAVRQQLGQMAERRATWPMEFRLIAPGGGIRWVRTTSRFVFDQAGRPVRCVGVHRDITHEREASLERHAFVSLVALANSPNDLREFLQAATSLVQEWSGCEAVGIRLRQGEDCPYYETRGFPASFVQAESQLCALRPSGESVRGLDGRGILECMCGNVLQGRFDPGLPFFTKGGSFWTNSTTEFLASTSEEDREARNRNRCNAFGYESLALVPLRAGGETLGLMQLSDRRKGRFGKERVEFFERLAGGLAAGLAQRGTQERLRQAELRYRTVADFTADLEYWLRPDGGLEYVSPACRDMTGYPPEALLARPELLVAMVHPEDRARFEEHHRCAGEGGPEVVTYRLRRADGQTRWVEHLCRAVADGAGKFLGRRVSVRDISDRKRVEEELRASETRYRAAVETQPDGFWVADREGRLLEVNEAYARLSGYSRGELLTLRITDLEARESAEEVAWHLRELEHRGSEVFESAHRAKDGTIIPVEASISWWPIEGGRFFAFFRDIRRRKRSEVLLGARVQLSELALHGTVDAVLQHALDAAELFTGSTIGFFHFVDDDQVHLTLQTWSTHTLHAVCTAEARGRHYPIDQAGVWVDCARTRAPVIHNDYASLPHRKGLPPGHAPVVRELVVPILRGGKVVAVVGVGNKPTDYSEDDVEPLRELASMAMDVVERKRAEEALERLYEQASADARTKARLLVEVNHRVKNNLLSLLGMLLAEKRLATDPTGASPGEPLDRIARRVRGLVAAHDLLSKVEWSPVLVTDLADRVIAGALPAAAASVGIEPSSAVVSPRQVGALALILNELATNTAKHARGAGAPRRVAVAVAEDGEWLEITYRDDGQGYPEEILTGGSAGIGLRLLGELAEGTLRGSLTLANDGGAVATVRLKLEDLGHT